jgi:DNA-binding transcriptional regulator YhcF (GntR family)
MTRVAPVVEAMAAEGYTGAAIEAVRRLLEEAPGANSEAGQTHDAISTGREPRQNPGTATERNRGATAARRGILNDMAVARKALGCRRDLRGSPTLVGFVLLDHFRAEDGCCCPSVALICRRAGLSRRTVQRALNKLEDAGFFLRLLRGGRGRANHYMPAFNEMRKTVQKFEATRANSARRALNRRVEKGVKFDARTHSQEESNSYSLSGKKPISLRTEQWPRGQRTLREKSVKDPEQQAHARLFSDLRDVASRFPNGESIMGEAIERTEDFNAALAAEISEPGSGIVILIDRLWSIPRGFRAANSTDGSSLRSRARYPLGHLPPDRRASSGKAVPDCREESGPRMPDGPGPSDLRKEGVNRPRLAEGTGLRTGPPSARGGDHAGHGQNLLHRPDAKRMGDDGRDRYRDAGRWPWPHS